MSNSFLIKENRYGYEIPAEANVSDEGKFDVLRRFGVLFNNNFKPVIGTLIKILLIVITIVITMKIILSLKKKRRK